jgi:hypothetical protein
MHPGNKGGEKHLLCNPGQAWDILGIFNRDTGHWGSSAGSTALLCCTDSADLSSKAELREQRGLTLYTLASSLQKQKAKFNPCIVACNTVNYFTTPVP